MSKALFLRLENSNLSPEQKEREAKKKIALEHFRNGHLAITAEDDLIGGGSPHPDLSKNPRKTLGELWDVEKIREDLQRIVLLLEKGRKEYKEKGSHHPDSHWPMDDIKYAKGELRKTLPYLKSIGKLPEKFENIKIEDLEDDPK